MIFFSALMSALYHLGIIQPVIRFFARVFRDTLRLSGAEALAGLFYHGQQGVLGL